MASILYAEDNLLNFELVRDILHASGHTIHWAKDGREALDRLRTHHVDLLLLDLHLPRIDGTEILTAVRTDRALSSLPVLVITADAMAGVSDSVLNEGADRYLAKPFKVKELIQQVEYLLHRRTAFTPSA